MNIIVCGHGAFAKEVIALCTEKNIRAGRSDDERNFCSNCVAIHCGTGRQLEGFLGDCGRFGIPVIQASSGQKLPDDLPCPVIDAPNLALPVVQFLKGLLAFVVGFEHLGLAKCLVESHQHTKKSVPETARRMADAICIPQADIHSVRDDYLQESLGVPHEHLGRHGYHWIKFVGDGIEIGLSTKVNGLRPYALGALHIAENALALHAKGALANGLHPVSEFI